MRVFRSLQVRAGARRATGVRELGSVLLVALLLGSELLTLGCGMLNPALAGDDSPHHAPQMGAEAVATHGSHASHDAVAGHAPAAHGSHDAPAPDAEHAPESPEAPPHHGGPDSGAADCMGPGSCGSVALDVHLAPAVLAQISTTLIRPDSGQSAASIVLALHRPPPKSI